VRDPRLYEEVPDSIRFTAKMPYLSSKAVRDVADGDASSGCVKVAYFCLIFADYRKKKSKRPHAESGWPCHGSPLVSRCGSSRLVGS
jgi:hypothetical protein